MEIVPKTVGHAQLLSLGLGVRELGRRLGVSPPAAQRYLRGERVPEADVRSRAESSLGIPAGDWDVTPGGAAMLRGGTKPPPPKPKAPPRPQAATQKAPPPPRYSAAAKPPPPPPRSLREPPKSDALQDQARYHLDEVREMRRNAEELGQLDFALKLLDLERKAILDLAKFTRELTPADESRLCETSAWLELRGRIVRALADYPEAARAVAEALGDE